MPEPGTDEIMAAAQHGQVAGGGDLLDEAMRLLVQARAEITRADLKVAELRSDRGNAELADAARGACENAADALQRTSETLLQMVVSGTSDERALDEPAEIVP